MTNADIYTCDSRMPRAGTVMFEGEKITGVFAVNDQSWKKAAGEDAEIRDMNGRMIVPGFADSHTHPALISQSTWHIKLPWTEDPDELLGFIRDYAHNHPRSEMPFLLFEFYPAFMFGAEGPAKELLDSAVSDRPCMCLDHGFHMQWVNSKMLKLMGITEKTKDPVPGIEEFVRDENGVPTGLIKEFAFLPYLRKMFVKMLWIPPIRLTPQRMAPFFRFNEEHGVLALGDGLTEGSSQLSAMRKLEKQGRLNLYYEGAVGFSGYAELGKKIKKLRRLQKKYSSRHININTMKLFLDGTNESGNSALLEPHANDPCGSNFGEMKMEAEELKRCFLLCNREAVDLHIHMVGDRAFRTACDAVESAQKEAEIKGEKWVCQPVFAHCELIHPDDMMRPAKLGITINTTPAWFGGIFGEEAMRFMTAEKWRSMYRFGEIIESDALVAFSSDEVSFSELYTSDPFYGMQTGITRRDINYPIDAGRYPGSVRPEAAAKLDRETLLRGYTLNSAKQLHMDDRMGSIERGKLANMCVLSGNCLTVPEEEMYRISCDIVVFEGKVIKDSRA